RKLVIGGSLLILILILIAFGYRPVQISYHRSHFELWRMIHDQQQEEFRRRWKSGVPGRPSISVANEQYHHHLRRLVELECIRFHSYRLKHIRKGTDEYDHFVRLVSNRPS